MLRTSKGPRNGKKIISLPIYDMMHTFEYTQLFTYEVLTDRTYDPGNTVPLDYEGDFLQDPLNMWHSNDIVTQYLNADENRHKPNQYLMSNFDALKFD